MNALEQLMEQKRQRDYELVRSAPTPEPPGYLEDMWDATVEWAGEAKDNFISLAQSTAALRINEVNSMMMEDTNNTNENVPIMTPEQVEMWEKHQEITDAFLNNTLRPVALGVSALATIPALFASAGVAVPLAAAFRLGAMAYTPFMLADIATSVKDNGVSETALETAKSAIPGYDSYNLEQDPAFLEYAEQHPGRAGWTRFTTALGSLGVLTHPTGVALGKAGRGLKKVGASTYKKYEKPLASAYQKAKDPLVHLTSQPLIAQQLHFMEQKLHLDKMREVVKKVKENKLRFPPKSGDEIAVENIAKDKEIKKNSVETKHFTMGGRDIEVAPSNLGHNVKLQNIFDTMKKIATVRSGHFRKGIGENVLGYYETIGEAIVVKDEFDFGTMSHEIGHHLDKQMKLPDCKDELEALYHKTWSKDDYKPHEWRGEGIAEFTREFFLNPEEAQRQCPKYYEAFTKALKENPEMAKNLDVLSNQIRQWYNQDGAAKLGASLLYEADKAPLSFQEALHSNYMKAKMKTVDRWAGLKLMTETLCNTIGEKLVESDNPYFVALGLRCSIAGKLTTLLTQNATPEFLKAFEHFLGAKDIIKHATFLPDVFKEIDFDNFNKKHNEWLNSVTAKDAYEGFAAYLTAKSAICRATEIGRRNAKRYTEQINKLLVDYENALKEGVVADIQVIEEKLSDLGDKLKFIDENGYDPDYKLPVDVTMADCYRIVRTAPTEMVNAGLKMREFNENMLNLSLHYDLIDKETHNFLLTAYPDYVPFQRVFDRDRYGISVSDIHSADNLVDIDSFIKVMSEEGSTKAIKDPIYEYAKEVQSIISKGEKNNLLKKIVALDNKAKGSGVYFRKYDNRAVVSDKDRTFAVWDKGKRQVYQATDEMLYNILSQTEDITIDADFKIAEVASSIFRTGVTSEPSFSLMNMCRDAITSFVGDDSKKLIPFIPLVDTIVGSFKRRDKQLMADFQVGGVQFSSRIGDSNSYRHMVSKQMGKKFSMEDGSPQHIAQWAKDGVNYLYDKLTFPNQMIEEAPRLTKFERTLKETGDYHLATRKAREQTVDFSQGGTTVKKWNKVDTFLNANIQGNRKFWNAFANPETREMAIKRSGLLVGATASLWMLNHNEEWYREINSDIKNRYWLFKVGDIVYRYPKPEAFGVVCSVVERMLDTCVDGNVEAPETLKPYLSGIALPNIIPRLGYVYFELMTNENFFTGQEIVSKQLQRYSPRYQYDHKSSVIAKAIGDVFNISPKKIDHAWAGITGTLGKGIMETVDYILTGGNTGRVSPTLEQTYGASRFMYDPTVGNEYVRMFYKRLDEMSTENYDKQRGAKKVKKDKALKNMEKARGDLSKVWAAMNDIDKQVAEHKMSPDVGRDKKKELREKATKIAKEALHKHTNYKY